MIAANERILTYLWFGYLPPVDVPDWFSEVTERLPEQAVYTVTEAIERLDRLVDRLVAINKPPYIVPLSGGWDSRLILAALRARTDNIIAVTLGVEGQLDYDIGALVAKASGVKHVSVSLSDTKLKWSDLEQAARQAPWTYLPDSLFLFHAYTKAIKEVEGSASIWSGFLGEALTGGHYHSSDVRDDVVFSQERFLKSQQRFSLVESSQLSSALLLPVRPVALEKCMSECEFLDLSVRQRGCIAGIVLAHSWVGWTAHQQEFTGGVKIVAPFADAEWAAYWLNAPRWHHKGQALYRRMAENRFPELFAIPSKHSWGCKPSQHGKQKLVRLIHGVRNRIHRQFPRMGIRSGLMDNYLNFQDAFRNREDYIEVMGIALEVLKKNDVAPWLNLDKLWDEHYRGKCDHAQAFQVLLGLAVNLTVNPLTLEG